MFGKAEIYTVYERFGELPEQDRSALVREGFCFWAFVFHIFWLLYKKQWMGVLLFAPIYVALTYATGRLGLPEATLGVQLMLQVWLGVAAHDLERMQLERLGYHLMDVVIAPDPTLAELRYLEHKHAAAA